MILLRNMSSGRGSRPRVIRVRGLVSIIHGIPLIIEGSVYRHIMKPISSNF